MPHPCLSCGACCATFRVGFHWSEASDACAGGVPVEMTVALRRHERAMRGTHLQSAPRCVALVGQVGADAHCGIYSLRPSPCRLLQPSWESGVADVQCDTARIAHGLAPLRPEDWLPCSVPSSVPADDAAAMPSAA